jgi:cell surface protein SprA
VTWGSAFIKEGKDFSSSVFSTMLNNRTQVSQLLGAQNSNSTLLPNGYYSGYSGSQQEVVMGAFLSAYTNTSVTSKSINPLSNLPLPNWTINYNGLSKFA